MFFPLLLASWALVAGWARPVTIGVLAVLLIYLDLASTGASTTSATTTRRRATTTRGSSAFLAGEEQPVRIDARTGIDSLWQPDTALLAGLDDVWGVAYPSLLAAYRRLLGGDGQPLDAALRLPQRRVPDWQEGMSSWTGASSNWPSTATRNSTSTATQTRCHARQIIHDAQLVSTADEAWNAVQTPGFDPAQQVVIGANAGYSMGSGRTAAPTYIRYD